MSDLDYISKVETLHRMERELCVQTSGYYTMLHFLRMKILRDNSIVEKEKQFETHLSTLTQPRGHDCVFKYMKLAIVQDVVLYIDLRVRRFLFRPAKKYQTLISSIGQPTFKHNIEVLPLEKFQPIVDLFEKKDSTIFDNFSDEIRKRSDAFSDEILDTLDEIVSLK